MKDTMGSLVELAHGFFCLSGNFLCEGSEAS